MDSGFRLESVKVVLVTQHIQAGGLVERKGPLTEQPEGTWFQDPGDFSGVLFPYTVFTITQAWGKLCGNPNIRGTWTSRRVKLTGRVPQ